MTNNVIKFVIPPYTEVVSSWAVVNGTTAVTCAFQSSGGNLDGTCRRFSPAMSGWELRCLRWTKVPETFCTKVPETLLLHQTSNWKMNESLMTGACWLLQSDWDECRTCHYDCWFRARHLFRGPKRFRTGNSHARLLFSKCMKKITKYRTCSLLHRLQRFSPILTLECTRCHERQPKN